MDIKSKELGLNITVKLDYKNYKFFLKKIKELGKSLESKSNVNNLKYSILCNFQKLPYMDVKGWCSRVVDKNGKVSEVLFLDYDNILYRLVESEVKYLIEEYNLSPFYVFHTEESEDENGEIYGSYHAICLTKLTFKQVVDIQNQLHCDSAFKKIPLIYRFKTWVLRIGIKGNKKKPIFKEIIGDISKEYNQDVSQAHLETLKQLYKFPEIKYRNLDGNHKLFLTKYVTGSP